MVETVIKECRNGLSGNWYEPYRIDYEDAIGSLEDTFTGYRRGNIKRGYLVELHKLEKGEKTWD